jgi:hypothetical protein
MTDKHVGSIVKIIPEEKVKLHEQVDLTRPALVFRLGYDVKREWGKKFVMVYGDDGYSYSCVSFDSKEDREKVISRVSAPMLCMPLQKAQSGWCFTNIKGLPSDTYAIVEDELL